jgi:hypothetical protein
MTKPLAEQAPGPSQSAEALCSSTILIGSNEAEAELIEKRANRLGNVLERLTRERLAVFCKEQELQLANSFLSGKKRIGVGNKGKTRACWIPISVYEKRTKLVIADPSERKELAAIGLRRLMRECKLSQAPVSKAIKGEPIRRTLTIIRQVAAKIKA